MHKHDVLPSGAVHGTVNLRRQRLYATPTSAAAKAVTVPKKQYASYNHTSCTFLKRWLFTYLLSFHLIRLQNFSSQDEYVKCGKSFHYHNQPNLSAIMLQAQTEIRHILLISHLPTNCVKVFLSFSFPTAAK